ncbi:hypothetical protein VCB98_10290 [Gammaproteobacteria bacterium AB-CW1]|uniref:Uncharacterized protein n=1 Tax=Natronospira elongata TaxID=3110268 RepID=A0AAP6JFS2_9GAMM|nr:hypothetical protein [Gammaproteobacteria bacterium AB-CW1]
MRANVLCSLTLGGLATLGLAIPGTAGEAPDPELLEFLGEFTGEDGEWVDPMDLYLLDEEAMDGLLEEDPDSPKEDDHEH